MEEPRKNILEAALLIDMAAKSLPYGEKEDAAHSLLEAAMNSLTEADTILFEEED